MVNETLIIIKPDAIQKGLIWEIISIFEKKNFDIKQLQIFSPNRTLLTKHYNTIWKLEERTSKIIANKVIDFMMEWPIIVIVLSKNTNESIIEEVRQIIWKTEPIFAEKGSIRNMYSNDSFKIAEQENRSIHNIIHASANKEEAEKEIELWFWKNNNLKSIYDLFKH